MPQANINIKIESKEEISEEEMDFISITAHVQEKNLNEISQMLKETLEVKSVPFLVVQLPQSLQGQTVPTFSANSFTHQQKLKHEKIYHYGNMQDKDQSAFMKKIAKIYHLMCGLENEAWLKIGFHGLKDINKKVNIQSEGHLQVCSLLEGMTVKGLVRLDQKSVSLFQQLTEKVSPQFNNSPLMAMAEIMDEFVFDIQFDSFSFLEQTALKQLFDTLKYKQDPDDRLVPKLREAEGITRIFITVPNLFSLQIGGESRVLGTLLSFL